jgi:hypothetical protein
MFTTYTTYTKSNQILALTLQHQPTVVQLGQPKPMPAANNTNSSFFPTINQSRLSTEKSHLDEESHHHLDLEKLQTGTTAMATAAGTTASTTADSDPSYYRSIVVNIPKHSLVKHFPSRAFSHIVPQQINEYTLKQQIDITHTEESLTNDLKKRFSEKFSFLLSDERRFKQQLLGLMKKICILLGYHGACEMFKNDLHLNLTQLFAKWDVSKEFSDLVWA